MLSYESIDLVNLPSDIIRKIISIEQESINYLRLIAPRWNTLALEHLAHSKHRPVINRLHLAIGSSGERTLRIHLSPRYLDYFLIQKIPVYAIPYIEHTPIIDVDLKGLSKPGDMVKLSKFLCQLIGRSSEIRCLVLNMFINDRYEEVTMFKNALKGATVSEIAFPSLVNFSKKSANIINDIVCACRASVKNIFVFAVNTTLDNDILDTLKNVFIGVETGELQLRAPVYIETYLTMLDDHEERDKIRKDLAWMNHVNVKIQAIKNAGENTMIKCYRL